MKPKPTFNQKAALIVFGFLLSLFILEVGLRLAGFTLAALQENRNRISLRKGGDYRILCLGESTTEGQYPSFLEASLNQNGGGMKFTVLDKGKGGTNTLSILGHAEAYLDQYHPDMVVAMMGINDGDVPHLPYENPSASAATLFLNSFTTYKLARLLWLHIRAKPPQASPAKDVAQSFSVGGLIKKTHKKVAAPDNLKKALELNPKDAWTYAQLGRFYLEHAAFAQAEASFKKAIEFDSKNEQAYRGLGGAYQQQGQLVQAEVSLKKSVELNPRDERAYNELGGFYQQQGEFAQAEANYKKVLELNPRDDSAYEELGDCYMAERQLSRAEASFKKVQELNPQDEQACLELGNIYQQQEQWALAEASFKKARELNPQDEQAYLGLGSAYQHYGQFARAEASLKKALELDPGMEDVYVALGDFYQQQGQRKQAERWLKKGLEFLGSNASSKLYGELAAISEKLGRNAHAQEYFDKASQSATVDAPAPNELAARNYRALKAMLDKKKIRLICVQYPMRPVAPLKKVFAGSADHIVFVDNESIFRDAVRENGLNAYFRDMFGGNFGHCTDKGNRLLGENIAKAILREMFGPSNRF